MSNNPEANPVVVLDFGAQYSKLFAKRVRIRQGLWIGAVCSIFTINVYADDLIPRGAIFSSATEFARLSPDGERIAVGSSPLGLFTLQTLRTWRSADAPEKPLDLRGLIVDAQWAYTNRHLIVTKRARNGTEVWLHDIETGEARLLSQDLGSSAILSARSPLYPTRIVLRVKTEEDADALFSVDIATEKNKLLTTLSPNEYVHFDARFRPRVLERPAGLCGLELFRRTSDGAWDSEPFLEFRCDFTNLDNTRGDGVRRVLDVDAIGDSLYFVDWQDGDRAALWAIDLESLDTTRLATDPDADITGAVLRDLDTGVPWLATAEFGDHRAHVLDPTRKAAFDAVYSKLGASFSVEQTSLDGSVWLVVALDGGPDNRFLFDVDAGRIESLGPRYTSMRGNTLAERRGYVVPADDGLRLPIHVYLPPGTDPDGDGVPESPLPALLYVHGGPTTVTSWDGWDGRTVRCQQIFANRGYAAVRVEFRGAGGFGNAFRERGRREWGGDALDDVVAVARWLVDRGIADADRIGIWGFSHGGYMALAALAFRPEVFACGFSWSGPAAFDVWMDNEELIPFEKILKQRYGDPDTADGLEEIQAQSPLYHSDAITKPLLLVYGGKDSAVPPTRHAEPLAQRLAALGRPVTYVLFPDETHGFSRTTSWIATLAIAEHFFAGHLGGDSEPFGATLSRGVNLEVRIGGEHIRGLEKFLSGG